MTEQERQAVEKCLIVEVNAGNIIIPKNILNRIMDNIEAALSELRKPNENLVNDIELILEKESEKSICVECDNFHSFPSLQPHSFNDVAEQIATLAPFNQNAELISKDEMFEFAAWMLWTFDTNLISISDSITNFYEQFKNREQNGL